MTTFPLCEKAGLVLCKRADDSVMGAAIFIRAADIEALLAAAPVVYGTTSELGPLNVTYWKPVQGCAHEETHTARLVCVEEIVRESEERQLLRELAALNETITNEWIRALSAKAKALLERKP